MTKTDDILMELNRAVATYLRGLQPFQYKNKTYRLIDNYVAVPYMKCDVCGDYPKFEISIIESSGGQRLQVGNDCINELTGQNVSEWFRIFRKKREIAMANREDLDQPALILTTSK